MNLLITGGAGFIGSHFVRAVLADRLPGLEGASVTVLDKLAYGGSLAALGLVAESKRLDFVPADAVDAPVVEAALRGHDAVVHFASAGAASDVAGVQVLLEAARRHDVARFLHVSTGDVYGSIDTGAWAERAPLAPTTPEAAGKAGADLMALAYHRTHGLPVVVTRCSDNYGPYQHPGRTVPRLVTSLLDGRAAALSGDGGRVRDWLHVDDHCHGIALALTAGRPGEIYHIAGSVELAERDLTELILAEFGLGWEHVATVPDGRTTDHRRALDDDKIRRELGWRPHVEFTAGLAATIDWYRANPTWWRPLLS
ncbi:dTDP-glucose 4,6-dehydratase [Paractinoplanes durhamensis]|uniref:dTDP-glucose 4,6-dehydratase n=1 Tax=Paractinoplanes durhamensis TaxID=113563 RepID=A0ABQ3YSR8_9ACTN|nr:GDP-mannose 4,6-dehydratase [Actinoplanes durhamensis]GIE00591.1 dTDP-glucose 4,6-dehydratase [Actinoplanes durhamensis]